jgi:chromosomal replication initiation ATPase DnaA
MTHAQQTQLLTILHLHHVTHGQDVSELIEQIKVAPTISPNEERLRKRISELKMSHSPNERRYKYAIDNYMAAMGIPTVTGKDVIQAIETVTGVSSEYLGKAHRDRPIVDARHLAFGFLYRYCPWLCYREIGQIFNRHHSTVIHSIKTFNALTQSDAGFADKRRKVEAILNGGKA